MNENFIHSDITEKIIKAFWNVYNELGYGFLEKVYERAMMIELSELGLNCRNQAGAAVYYKGHNVGDYFADLLVEDKVIVELKAVETVIKRHEVQLVHYLKATDIEVGLLLNFGPKPEMSRRVFTKEYKEKLRKKSV